MVENGKHDGPATHSVTFVWNGHEVLNDISIDLFELHMLHLPYKFWSALSCDDAFCLILLTLQGENVELIGDFTGWKEQIKATHKGGPRYEAEVRLAQGK